MCVQQPAHVQGGLEEQGSARGPVVHVVHPGREARRNVGEAAVDEPGLGDRLATNRPGWNRCSVRIIRAPVSVRIYSAPGIGILQAQHPQLSGSRDRVPFVERLGVAAAVLHGAVSLGETEREASRKDVLVEGSLDGALEVAEVEVAELGAQEGVELARRLARVDLDRSGRRVARQTGPLGPAQHVDGLDVEEGRELERRGVSRHVVLIDGDGTGRVGVEVVEADAADEEGRRRRAVRHDFQVGGEGCDVSNALDTQRCKILGAEAGHGVGGLEIARGLRFPSAHDELFDPRTGRRLRCDSLRFFCPCQRCAENRDRETEPNQKRTPALRVVALRGERSEPRPVFREAILHPVTSAPSLLASRPNRKI